MPARKTQLKRKTKPEAVIEVAPGDKRAVGRPAMPYDAFVAKVLLEEISQGEKSIRAILESRPGFYPSRATLWKWLRENPEFAVLYGQAKQEQVESFVDDTTYKSDTATPETVGVVNLQIKARQWQAERLNAKKYGAHLDHTHTALVQTSHVPLLEHLDPGERQALRELLLAATARANAASVSERTGAPMIEAKAKTINPKAKMGRTAAKRAG